MPPAIDKTLWWTAYERTVLYLPHVALAVVLLIVFWFLAIGVARLIDRAGTARHMAADALLILSRGAKLSVQALGLVTAMGTLGINVTALVAGLGLTGFAVGFALKDIISNTLAGILILIYKPFQRQDRISVVLAPSNLEGHVVQVNLRYTTLQLPDRKILIPNANLFTNPIMVFQAPAAESAPPAGGAAAPTP